jgi:hypothetical protein
MIFADNGIVINYDNILILFEDNSVIFNKSKSIHFRELTALTVFVSE